MLTHLCSFPLAEHICALSPDVGPPTYLIDSPMIDLSTVTEADDAQSNLQSVDVVNSWPDNPQTTLDDTQWEAMQQILTKSLAIVQGPPGTGKTFVSKMALEVLVKNRSPNDPPIIIAAQTNHALDQLLGHVSVFDPNFIRLGGRSTNLEVKQRALYEVRSKERIPLIPGGLLGKANSQLRAQGSKLIEILQPLARGDNKPYSAATLTELGIITQAQRKSLEAGAAQWVSAGDDTEDPMQLWLNKALVPFEVTYQPDNFGFDSVDEDLEYEQLRENEAEAGVADEEDIEMLKGQWCGVYDRLTTPSVSPTTMDRAKRLLDTTSDLWKVPEALRGPMYAVMQQKAKTGILVKFREDAIIYDKIVKDLKVGKWERDAVFLERANIIGMTTTGLGKYRPLIASLKPKIILIEEAAEVIEAPVTAACVDSLEHLILVGDHQQLQGHCSVQELEGDPYYLNVSMFQRLVENNFPYKTLPRQRRMNPEFRQLLNTLYPDLQDHASVVNRACPAFGMGPINSFFFHHENYEDRDSTMSAFNDQEARFITKFYRYLVKNEVHAGSITILTFYNGQRKRILKELRDDPELKQLYHNVKTVDSYQGEENAIVILSLVRSNDRNQIGFLENEHRVCVALSRAKFGFFLFGNSSQLANGSELWEYVAETMNMRKRLGHALPIQCTKHRRTMLMEYPEDWDDNPDGGCDLLCGESMPCGHQCPLRCHIYPHSSVLCQNECQKQLSCGHKCSLKCHEQCSCPCDDFAQNQSWSEQPPEDEGASDGPSRPRSSGQSAASGQGQMGVSGARAFKSGGTDYRNEQGSGFHHALRSSLQTYNGKCAATAYGYTTRTDQSRENHLQQPSHSSNVSYQSRNTSAHSQAYDCGPLISPKKEQARCSGWASFANGGFKLDDAARLVNQSSKDIDIPKVSSTLLDLSPMKQKRLIEKEMVQVMSNGRLKTTQEYLPPTCRDLRLAASPLKRADGASSSRIVECGAISLLD